MRTTAPRAAYLITFIGLLGLVGCRLSYTGGARSVSPNELDDGWLRAAPTPVVRQQHQADCGLAALAMVAGAWGKQWTIDELSRHARPSATGVKLGVLRDVARKRGFEAYAISGKPADLERELSKRRPVMLGLQLPLEQRRAVRHYEVVVAFNPRDGSVVSVDPATGKYLRRTKAVLEAEWKPSGYATLVVIGNRATPRGTAHAAR